MPQRKSAKKELRADKDRRKRNLTLKTKIKQSTKKYLRALKEKDLDEAQKALNRAYKELDKAAAKKYIHKNKASRKKSHLASKITAKS